MTSVDQSASSLIYKVNDEPKNYRDWILYSLQWVVTMVYAVVWGYAIVGIEMNFNSTELASYMASIILTIGLSTFLQSWQGHKMAMVSGPNVIPSLAIVAAITAGGREYAQHAFMAQAIAGLIIVILALLGISRFIKKIWSPLILGSMVLMVGLSISGQGLKLLTEQGFGWHFFVGIGLALGGTFLAIRGRGIWATLPPLFVIILGYGIFMVAGDFNWELITISETFVLPQFLPYGLNWPPIDLIFIMVVVNLMAALNHFGNVKGYADVVNEKVDDKRMNRSFTILGAVETILPGMLGVPATVAYGENLGIVMLTKVAARSFIIVASIIFFFMAFIGPMGGIMAAMPKPIAGAVLLGIASSVVGIGANMMMGAPEFKRREQTLVGFSVFLSLGLFLLPKEDWKDVPRILATIFSNPIISVIIFVMFFERIIFPKNNNELSQGAQHGK